MIVLGNVQNVILLKDIEMVSTCKKHLPERRNRGTIALYLENLNYLYLFPVSTQIPRHGIPHLAPCTCF